VPDIANLSNSIDLRGNQGGAGNDVPNVPARAARARAGRLDTFEKRMLPCAESGRGLAAMRRRCRRRRCRSPARNRNGPTATRVFP
jgi:hypothetical protein